MVGPTNIADYLSAQARVCPQAPAVVCPAGRDSGGRARYVQYTFAELDRESDLVARGLAAMGIVPGTRTVLMAPPSLDFFVAVFALFKAGAVMICVDPGLGTRNLGRCLGETAPEAFIGVAKAHWARRLFRWGAATCRTNILLGRRGLFSPRMPTLADVRERGLAGGESHRQTASSVAAILFTSGSTGIAKGVVYQHSQFIAQIEALRKTYQIAPGEVDLATFPLFALFAPALGMTAVVPEMDFTKPGLVDPEKILEPIENWIVTSLFGSPALLDRVGAWCAERGIKLPSLRRVISAGAPVAGRIVERFAGLLPPGGEVFTPYGATEALPVASIGSSEILAETRRLSDQGRGTCVGRPVDGVRVRIIRIDDAPIERWTSELLAPPGEIGEIVVSGPAVTTAYYNRPESTRLAKIEDLAGCIWHRMGDVGYMDEQGRLWFCGRKSQRVVTGQGPRFTIPCEGVFNSHEQVRRTALVGVRREGVVQPALCVELLAPLANGRLRTLRDELLALGARYAHTRDIREIHFHPRFPVDVRHNAKIGREQLAQWAQRHRPA